MAPKRDWLDALPKIGIVVVLLLMLALIVVACAVNLAHLDQRFE